MYFIDGLECGRYDRRVLAEFTRRVLAEFTKGGMAAVTITLSFWEDALETMDAIAAWNDLARANSDLVTIARTAEDIVAAADSGRTAVVLGSQNSSPVNDRLGFVELFTDMGLRVMQLTYNNQNAIGGSCYEPHDSGVSRFGREVIAEMNRVGMLVDLSHVGERTSFDAIKASDHPLAITHANPRSLYDHPRNKSDDLLRALAAGGGVLGLATYNNICGPYAQSPQAWCDMVARTVDLIGIDAVAIGTDLGQNSGPDRLEWMRKGKWTRSEQPGASLPGTPAPPQEWLRSTLQFPDIAAALRESGRFNEAEIEAITGGNWLRLYRQVFGS
ncbi:peptidase M19 [Streptomyces corchorusii]|uniref:Peptidase M19 n=2 Tax=Streptomyces TaxID=1883 RepID=A0A101PU11_STRCK|nr:membrane dipeptidase [Streptomyces corchorusii]KUN17631.1 peptidase M19 [Streptomyces corchorusii]